MKRKNNKRKNENKNKICKYAHCEVDMWGSELCCEKNGNSYCKFDRRQLDIDYSECNESILVSPKEWEKHAIEMGWYR